jgi:hypothetical protein
MMPQLKDINNLERNNMKKEVKSIKDLQRLMETLGAKKETGDGWASWTIDAGPGRWTHTDLSKLQASSAKRQAAGPRRGPDFLKKDKSSLE